MNLFNNTSFAEEIAEEMERLESHAHDEEQSEGDRVKTEALNLIVSAAEDLELAGKTSEANVLVSVLQKIANLPPNPGKTSEEKETWRMYGYKADDKNMAHDKKHGHRYDPQCRCADCVEHEEVIQSKIRKEERGDKNKASDVMSDIELLSLDTPDLIDSYQMLLDTSAKDFPDKDKYIIMIQKELERRKIGEDPEEPDAFEELLRENAESY